MRHRSVRRSLPAWTCRAASGRERSARTRRLPELVPRRQHRWQVRRILRDDCREVAARCCCPYLIVDPPYSTKVPRALQGRLRCHLEFSHADTAQARKRRMQKTEGRCACRSATAMSGLTCGPASCRTCRRDTKADAVPPAAAGSAGAAPVPAAGASRLKRGCPRTGCLLG